MKCKWFAALSAVILLLSLDGCGEKEDMSTPITGEVVSVDGNTIQLKTDSKTYKVKVTDATVYTYDMSGMPEGMTGEAPEMPADGETPEGFTAPENGEIPEMPADGEMPEGFTAPENGEMPEKPTDGEMPEMPQNGGMSRGGFGGFTLDLSSVTVGSTVTIERSEDGTAARVLLTFSPQNMDGPVGNES